MYNYNEERLADYIYKQKVCPKCGGSRAKGGHFGDCVFKPYMRFLPKELKVGDEVGLPAYEYGEFYPCVVTKIIDDFTCELYEKSIGKIHVKKGSPIWIKDSSGHYYCGN